MLLSFLKCSACRLVYSYCYFCFKLPDNDLPVTTVGDLGALHCQPAQKFDRSTQLQVCTSPPIEAARCYHQNFLVCRGLLGYLLLSFSLSFAVQWGILKISFFSIELALQALLKTLV